MMAGEGFDAPKASIGIWLSFNYNGNLALQQCYRIMRRNYNIKNYETDTCIMLVPSDSNAIALFEKLRQQCEIEFEEKKIREPGIDSWPPPETITEIVDAQIREWRGEVFTPEKEEEFIKTLIKKEKLSEENINNPAIRKGIREEFESWHSKRNEKIKQELTKEHYQKYLERQVGSFAGQCIQIIYNGNPSIKGAAGDYKMNINYILKRMPYRTVSLPR